MTALETRTRPAPPAAPHRRGPRIPSWLTRLLACLGGSLVLALMIGDQEGSQTDYGLTFRKQILAPRVFAFLALGVLLFLCVSYWPRIKPYLTRPGFWPLISGGLAVLASITLMHWFDQAGNGKFGAVSDAVSRTSGISPIATAFYGWLAWTMLVVSVVVGGAAIVIGLRWLAFGVAALAVVAAVITYLAHQAVVDFTGQPDHSLGYLVSILGYIVILSGMLAAGLSHEASARSKHFVTRVLGFRPGLPLVIVGFVVTLLSFVGAAAWFSPSNKNTSLSETHDLFASTSINPFALNYLGWLSWVVFVGTLALAAAATWYRHRLLGWLAALAGAASTIITLVVLYDISKLGARTKFDGATGPWQNLGVGGWMACGGLFLLGSAGFVVATSARATRRVAAGTANGSLSGSPNGSGPNGVSATGSVAAADAAPATQPSPGRRAVGYLTAPGAARSAVLIAIAAALFYPPTATPFWQQVVVSEIGISMLLAAGLNVVVGWAGLLDLGFIAFYAIGSYTTAYFVGSLPVKPPSWLHMTPLLTIPFAIIACLMAGVILGAPTLRLRGDYLAIVTLGFGEIIHLAAVNSQSITNGAEGLTNDTGRHTKSVPNPSIHIGPLHIHWGLNQLQYWYLLLVFLVVVLLAFRRLEHSRLGRAWAAVREDEVAAQATGINTTKVKLAAFAIGASTSGVAGVFFASQIGTFTPDNFVLNNSILIVAYVVFGGMGSLPGALAGAAMLTWLPEFLKSQVPSSDRLMWIGAVVMLMMIFRPAGLIPARRRAAELSGLDGSSSSETRAVPAGEGL